jgi:hypothetical protein
MKRLFATVAIAIGVALTASAQLVPDLGGFKSTFEGFAKDVAGALTLNSSAGSTWSDAYVGGFPHFGVGLVTSTAFAPSDAVKTIFDAFGVGLPSPLDKLESLGMPVPALAASFKIGLPFIPIDVGIKGGLLPTSLGESLKASTGVSASYTNIGLTARYALVKQNILLPAVSVGASYNYQEGSIVAPMGIKTPSMSLTVGSDNYSIGLTQPELSLDWSSHTFDFTAQVSKTLLFFITPYVGAGYTLGSSKISGGLNSSLEVRRNSVVSDLDTLKAAMKGAGLPLPFNGFGIGYSAESTDPVLRLYGGLSLNILLIRLDLQAVYVPAMASQAQALGASFTTRVQI